MASILVIGPHPDDQELGMGGSIARLAGQGHRVHLLDMTNGEPTPLGTPETPRRRGRRRREDPRRQPNAAGSAQPPGRPFDRSPPQVAAVIRPHRPDWIFLPYPVDAHPDHVAVTRIGEDARFDAKLTKTDIPGEPWYPKRIIYYFCTHLRMNFSADFLPGHQRSDRDQDRGRVGVRIAIRRKLQPRPADAPHHERLLRRPHRHRLCRAVFRARSAGVSGLDQLV